METTIIALRNLYVAMGGKEADVANLSVIPDLITAIATLISSGATAEVPQPQSADEGKTLVASNKEWVIVKKDFLPSVSASDNGKVLKVVDGAWEAAE